MKHLVLFFSLFMFLGMSPLWADTQAELQTKLADKITQLKMLANQAVVVDAVKAQNSKGLSLGEIKKRDTAWVGGDKALQAELAASSVGTFLNMTLTKNSGLYAELFVTDSQGANVACAPATSDYWQGDEEKWIAAFANGKGAVFIGKADVDMSTKSSSVQVSVPVMDGNKAIGVLVAGIRLSYILGQ